jgi:hypothetical protein
MMCVHVPCFVSQDGTPKACCGVSGARHPSLRLQHLQRAWWTGLQLR